MQHPLFNWLEQDKVLEASYLSDVGLFLRKNMPLSRNSVG